MGSAAFVDRRASHSVCQAVRGHGAAASEGGRIVPGTRPSHRGGDPPGTATDEVLGQPAGCAPTGTASRRAHARGAGRTGIWRDGDRGVAGGQGGSGSRTPLRRPYPDTAGWASSVWGK